MDWLRPAIKNVVRRPMRSLLTVVGVAIAVGMLFNLIYMGIDDDYPNQPN